MGLEGRVGSALLIGTIALIKKVHKGPLIFPSCKRGEEGEEEEREGCLFVSVSTCTLLPRCTCVSRRQPWMSASASTSLEKGSPCLLLMRSLCQAGWLGVSRHSPISTSQALLEPWDYIYVLQCQAFSSTWGLRNSNSGPYVYAPNILPTEPSPQFQKLSSNELGNVSSSDSNLS